MKNDFQLEEIKRFVSLLTKHKVNDQLILIGSWATYFYQSIWPTYQSSIRTTDMDLYTGFSKTSQKVDLPKILKDHRYLVEIKNGSYQHYIFTTRGFEIEFVTHLRRNQDPVILVKNLNVKAVPLPHHEKITIDQTFPYEFEDGSVIRIIRPSLYVIMKLLINRNRRQEKSEKDLESIRFIIPFLLDDPSELDAFKKTINTLSNAQKKRCLKSIERGNLKELTPYFLVKAN
jgi:hypothetical protein